MNPFLVAKKPELEKVVTRLKHDFSQLRSGRANSAQVETILVDAYGAKMEMKALASIGTTDARTLVVDPWDKGLMKPIEKALTDARLGTTPTIDGAILRLAFPPMTTEAREQVVKQAKQKLEEARISIRQIREEIRAEITEKEKSGAYGEDERFRQFAELDTLIKEYNVLVEELTKSKEEETLTI